MMRLKVLAGLVGLATAAALCSLALACWVSTLPAISPVSLSLAFRSWTRILEFSGFTWLATFGILAFVFLPLLLRPKR